MKAKQPAGLAWQAKKSALLAELLEVRQAILDRARHFTPAQAQIPFLGHWSLLDVLAHLAGWDETNLSAAQDILNGKLPDFYAHFDKDWATYNAGLVARFKAEDLDDMLVVLQKTQAALLQYLETLAPEQIYWDQGVRHGRYKVITSRLLEAEKGDEHKHLAQIEDFLVSLLAA